MNSLRNLVRIGTYMGFTSLSEFLKQATDVDDVNIDYTIDYSDEEIDRITMELMTIIGELSSVLSREEVAKVGGEISDAISRLLEVVSKGKLKTKQTGINLWKQLRPGNPPVNVNDVLYKG